MRTFVIATFVCLGCIVAAEAYAKPKVAVTPFDGDKGDKIGNVVADSIADDVTVVKPKESGRAMEQLGVSGELDPKATRKLQRKLEAGVVVQGTLGKDDGKRTLKLTVTVRGKKPTGFTIQFKATTSKFRASLRDELMKRIGDGPTGDGDEEDDDDEAAKAKAAKAKQAADEEEAAQARKRKADDEDAKTRERQRKADERETSEKGRRKRIAADDDEDSGSVRKKKSRKRDRDADEDAASDDDSDDESDNESRPRRRARLVAVRVDVGVSAGIRRLTYTTSSPMAPPRVGTAAGAGRIAGEIYPIALANPKSSAAGLGIFGLYDKTVGLSITIPGTTTDVPIDQAHYAIGTRYRFRVGAGSSIALGVSYARRRYIADRSGLAMAGALDAPDVDYKAVAPGIALRVPVTPKAALFATADALLMLATGEIQKSASYGPADVFGIDAMAGVDIALGKQVGLRFLAEYSQINFTFTGTGAMAMARGVSAATDRGIGVSATLGVMY